MSTENAVKNPAERSPAEHTRTGLCFRPNVDIEEREDELLVVADIPGAKSDGIDVNFEDGMLTLHAAVPARQAEDQRFWREEYGVGDFYRTFQVNETIDAAKITAEYADGVLTLHLPKTEASKPRKIQVRAG
jgi:HSP20 family protein